MTVDEKFRLLVVKYRDKHGLTDLELADKIGVSNCSISRLRRGLKTATLKEAWDISKVLGFNLSKELGRDA